MSYESVLKQADRLRNSIRCFILPYEDKTLTIPIINKLADKLSSVMKAPDYAVRSSLVYLIDEVFSRSVIDEALYRLSANIEGIQKGGAFGPVEIPESCTINSDFQIISIYRREGSYRLKVRILYGKYCNKTVSVSASDASLRKLSRLCGMSTRKYPPMIPERGLPGLLFTASMVISSGRPRFDSIEENESLIQYNRKNFLRYRYKYVVCPLNQSVATSCWNCKIGRDKCPAAILEVSEE